MTRQAISGFFLCRLQLILTLTPWRGAQRRADCLRTAKLKIPDGKERRLAVLL